MRKRLKENSLYLVITEEYCAGKSVIDVARQAIAGGADIIQMREKSKSRDELVALGKELAVLCRKSGVTFIVNDDPVLAKEVGADGVHLGQEDLKEFSLDETRRILGVDKIIGISTHSVEQFTAGNKSSADYLAFGPVFKTKTKDYFLGTGDVAEVARSAKKPVFFIGGIDLSNVGEVLKCGARNIALIRGITEASDIEARTRGIKERIRGKRGR